MSDPSRTPSGIPTSVVVCSAVVLVAMFAMAFFLALGGRSIEYIVALMLGLGGVAASILPLIGQVIRTNENQNHQLHQLANGQLTARIKAAVQDAMGLPVDPPPPAAAGDAAEGAGR